jgi:hypothetical protein
MKYINKKIKFYTKSLVFFGLLNVIALHCVSGMGIETSDIAHGNVDGTSSKSVSIAVQRAAWVDYDPQVELRKKWDAEVSRRGYKTSKVRKANNTMLVSIATPSLTNQEHSVQSGCVENIKNCVNRICSSQTKKQRDKEVMVLYSLVNSYKPDMNKLLLDGRHILYTIVDEYSDQPWIKSVICAFISNGFSLFALETYANTTQNWPLQKVLANNT